MKNEIMVNKFVYTLVGIMVVCFIIASVKPINLSFGWTNNNQDSSNQFDVGCAAVVYQTELDKYKGAPFIDSIYNGTSCINTIEINNLAKSLNIASYLIVATSVTYCIYLFYITRKRRKSEKIFA